MISKYDTDSKNQRELIIALVEQGMSSGQLSRELDYLIKVSKEEVIKDIDAKIDLLNKKDIKNG